MACLETRYNEPLNNEVLSIKNNILRSSNSKMGPGSKIYGN